jgi:methenyltetrahydromethanopterin cyclohydrolase
LPISLNELAWKLADRLASDAERLNVAVSTTASGTRLIDCGVKAPGGLEAGRLLAQICLADCGRVQIEPTRGETSGQIITVQSDQPLLACLASQYAGWQITGEKYFAMGSGPMRAAALREPLFEELGVADKAPRVVGVLETSKLPPDAVCDSIASSCGVPPTHLTLLAARTASLAGTVQIVARALETALHKLHTLHYDLKQLISGYGSAPLPPVAADDMVGIGRTNDAVLYGGEVTLWLRDNDEELAQIGPKIPSSASPDFGEPFADIFKRFNHDFYKIDPLLFSPAAITLMNLTTGRAHRFGQTRPDVLAHSFGR